MTALVWDEVGSRRYESGLDKGVLFLLDGRTVPWNGLVSVTEKSNRSANPVYFDGKKINDLVYAGDFSGTLTALTFPDEFIELEGFISPREGMYVGNQQPKSFHLCYRTRIGDDVLGDSAYYKLHILYNVIAMPSDRQYQTVSDSLELVEFEWDIEAIPEEVEAFRPTAHVVIDSRHFDEVLLAELEIMLYGTPEHDPMLMPLAELITFLDTWYSIELIDHGDGTWSALVHHEELLTMTDAGTGFIIEDIDGEYLDPTTYRVSSTTEAP